MPNSPHSSLSYYEPTSSTLDGLEKELQQFEAEQREALGLDTPKKQHWYDSNPHAFSKQQRAKTTLLIAGFTLAHDQLIQSAFRSMGYNMLAIDQPDNESLRFGREYGNRGQCNPTYFTVGNLIKYLTKLRDSGVSTQDIIDNYVFATVGSCGPCRFGTYITEYRKALRDAGFEGFRVIQFQQTKGINQEAEEDPGVEFGPKFFWYATRAVVIGDVLNILGYRIRPYEIVPGSTNIALEKGREIICQAFENRTSIIRALWQVRKELASIKVDRSQIKPKVSIIGEFWAMTTEGDGNYRMHSFLEQEGAELEIQTITSWVLYLLWQGRYDTEQRANLKGADKNDASGSRFGLAGINVRKRLLLIKTGERFMQGLFYSISALLGLKDYKLANMDYIAKISAKYYDNNLKGGEGHMEVGKLISNSKDKKVNMTISVKPFGCMPSSGVSDGVQSLITELYPECIFLPLETNGDGAVNFYSRIQMQLFKAKSMAETEVEQTMQQYNLTEQQFHQLASQHHTVTKALHRSPMHSSTCTAAATLKEIAGPAEPISQKLGRLFVPAAKQPKVSSPSTEKPLHWVDAN